MLRPCVSLGNSKGAEAKALNFRAPFTLPVPIIVTKALSKWGPAQELKETRSIPWASPPPK